METFIKVNGQTIKLMVMEYIHIMMEDSTRDNGNLINSMDMAVKIGLTVQHMKDSIKMG